MERILNYYYQQANSTNNSSFDYLTFDRDEIVKGYSSPKNTEINVAYEILLLFLHYLIAFPVFLLCWFALIAYLRKSGHINNTEAQIMMDELKNVRIASGRQ
jgi:hypothetical protein